MCVYVLFAYCALFVLVAFTTIQQTTGWPAEWLDNGKFSVAQRKPGNSNFQLIQANY